jgi:hypothetical protein
MQSYDLVAARQISHKRHYVAMFLWLLLAFFFVSLVGQWITINSRDQVFAEYIDQVIKVAANQQRPAKEVRALILIKAEDLSLPVQGNEVQINGYGRTLRATVRYKAGITMPIVNQPVYRISLQHDSRS